MESDQYMPEYWSANKIIGKLEKALINAENILGLIQSTQIASLEAGKVTGLITSAQIKEVEAAKLAGQLTSAQIKEIEAAKIAGQLSSSQLAVNSVTAEKIAALSITAGKLASESVTTEKLAANSVTAAKIVAGSITAEKLSVIQLSSISANLGTVTAGTISGTNILLEEGSAALHRIRWLNETKVEKGGIFTTEEPPAHTMWLEGKGTKSGAALSITGADEAGIGASVGAVAVEGEAKNSKSVTVISSSGASSFMQLAGIGRQERDFGKVTSLPKEPINGDRCKFVADKTKGILWDLTYNSETKYWEKTGGQSLYSEVNAGQATASAAYVNLATKGPELIFPLSGDYRLEIGGALWNTAANCHARMGVSVNGAEPTVEIDTNQPTAGSFSAMNCYRKLELLGMVAGQTALAKYRQISGGEGSFSQRWIALDPVRVK